MSSSTRYARHSGRSIGAVADGINRVAVATNRGNGRKWSCCRCQHLSVVCGWHLCSLQPPEAWLCCSARCLCP
eukprot:6193964-Pleurochrysis_carterae.AAC.2